MRSMHKISAKRMLFVSTISFTTAVSWNFEPLHANIFGHIWHIFRIFARIILIINNNNNNNNNNKAAQKTASCRKVAEQLVDRAIRHCCSCCCCKNRCFVLTLFDKHSDALVRKYKQYRPITHLLIKGRTSV